MRTLLSDKSGPSHLMLAPLFACLLLVLVPASAQDTGSTSSELVAAAPDVDTPAANATVLLTGANSRCTGTLIAPQVVVTAGHCGFYDGRLGLEPDRWYEVASAGIAITASFGPDARAFRDQVSVTHVNISGNRDLQLLALARAPAGAAPAPVLTSLPEAARRDPAGFWARQTFLAAGWGGQDPGSHSGRQATVRQRAGASGAVLDCSVGWPDALCVRGTLRGREQTRGGDSGGPLYWTDPADGTTYLVGVLQGYGAAGTTDHYHYTWSEHPLAWPADAGDPPGQPIGLSQRDWLRNATDRSLCGVLRRHADDRARLRRVYHWWSPSRGDNFTTADPAWAGCDGDARDGYRFVGVLGTLHSPEHPQPPGTAPLYHWWSPSRGDNFVSTDPRWAGTPGARRDPDYRLVRTEGYVLAPDSGTGAGKAPLWSWYSPTRGDNFATTDPRWAPDSRDGHGPDYRYYRHEGFLLAGDGGLSLAGEARESAPSATGAPRAGADGARRDRYPATRAAFAEAEAVGALIEGVSDLTGLRRVVERSIAELGLDGPLFRPPFDADRARELGIREFAELAELEAMARLVDIEVYRVEYVPGLRASGSGNPIRGLSPDDGLGYAGSDFSPGLPSRGSLAAQDGEQTVELWFDADGNVTHKGTVRTGDGYRETTVYHTDGTIERLTETVYPDGSSETELSVRGPDGENVRYQHRQVDRRNGVVVDTEQEGDADPETRVNPIPPEEGEGESGESGGSGDSEGADGDTDQFQPSEGGGVFCPLSLEICRRGLQRALDSQETVFVGTVRINPGDPDDEPSGDRLIVDAEGLVINPNPERAHERDAAGVDPGVFRLTLPVWVNPPGPGED